MLILSRPLFRGLQGSLDLQLTRTHNQTHDAHTSDPEPRGAELCGTARSLAITSEFKGKAPEKKEGIVFCRTCAVVVALTHRFRELFKGNR